MIGAAFLIPAGLLATQITISEVSAEREIQISASVHQFFYRVKNSVPREQA